MNSKGISLSETEEESQQNQKDVDEEVENPHEEETPNKKYRFAIISDLNGSFGSKAYGRDVSRAVDYIVDDANGIDFTISTGDMVAGQKSNLDYEGMWESFHTAVTRRLLSNEIPLFPSPGNHDASISRKTERGHYNKSWINESSTSIAKDFKYVEGVEQNFPFQYAFTIGKALFIALDNTDTKPWSDESHQWISDVLDKNQKLSPKFVFGHVPILPFAFNKETEYLSRGSSSFLKKVEDLFEEFKVDVFFSGHSHVYYPGHRDRYTEYISVPLLGSGTRFLMSKQTELKRSKRGFLTIEFDSKGQWDLEHRSSSDYSLIEDSGFPLSLDMPDFNSSKCKSCTSFPNSHFLDANKRIIYRRSDQ